MDNLLPSREQAMDNARKFSERWRLDPGREEPSAKSFWDELFAVFGLYRRQHASMEYRIPIAGKADLFWKGKLLIEHKSRDLDLDEALEQAKRYAFALPNEERPKWILTSDFARINKYRMMPNGLYTSCANIRVDTLADHYDDFDFFTGVAPVKVIPTDPLNFTVTEKLGAFFQTLLADNYNPKQLPLLLTRLVFCMFAQHSGIFAKGAFTEFLETSHPDGQDLGSRLNVLFQTLNQPYDRRPPRLSKMLKAFPYVNGALFEERIDGAAFDSPLRDTL